VTNYGGLLLKPDSVGAVQWERVLGPDGSTTGMLNAIQQTYGQKSTRRDGQSDRSSSGRDGVPESATHGG